MDKNTIYILLLEDDPDVVLLMKGLLAKTKFISSVVEDAACLSEAIEKLKDGDFDIILSDLNVPDSKGVDILNKFRETAPDMPIVVVTGTYDDAFGNEAICCGTQDFLTKDSLNTQTLEHSILYAIERKKIQKQLIKTEKMAAVSRISAETAHEIKNQMGVIRAGLYYVKMLIPDENTSAHQTFQKMDKAVAMAKIFIDDLLNISVPLDLIISQIDINNLIIESIKEIPREIFTAIKVNMDLSKKMPNIAGDINKLKQVMVNLIKNAAISMELSKTKKLTIKSRLDGNSAVLSVTDTGIGISNENIEKIFEPFYMQTMVGQGGLGLTIVKRFIEAHNGIVEVTSQVGVGTTFTVRLPIKSIGI